MPAMPVGTCRTCGAAVPSFARTCPTCGASNLPNPIAVGISLAAAAVIVVAVALVVVFWPRGNDPQATLVDGSQKAQPGDQYDWLVTAMAECEEEAKRTTDKLYFLVAPLRRTATSAAGWVPGRIGTIGETTDLVPSSNAVIGLRNGSLAIYREPVTFAVSDPASNTTYQWRPAVGVSVLTQKAGDFETLKLGLQLADGKQIEWGLTIALTKGTCYWIFPLIRTTARKQ